MKKISSMLKLLSLIALISLSTNLGAKTIDEKVYSYEKHKLKSNPNVKLNKLELKEKKNIVGKWNSYKYNLDVVYNGKALKTYDLIFSNGKMVSSTVAVFKNSTNIDEDVYTYENGRLKANPNITLKSIKLIFKKDLGDGWNGYVYSISLIHKEKNITTNDTIFSNGKIVSSDLRLLNGLDLKRKMHPTLDERYYKQSHLIAGNKNAKHKLVIFSDPLCPMCIEDTPRIIKDVQENPKELSLYYVAFPLDMHPTAKTLSKAAMIAHEQGIKNIDYKVYNAGFDFFFDAYKNKDNQKSLDAFNKVIGTNITMKQINNKNIDKKLKYDMKLADDAFINGTPTLFLDGEIDLIRSSYKKFIK